MMSKNAMETKTKRTITTAWEETTATIRMKIREIESFSGAGRINR
jgi:hypothetical protein